MALKPWQKFGLLFALAYHADGQIHKNLETREMYIWLDSDGNLIHPFKVPDCGSGRKIFLISYSYQQTQCDYDCHTVRQEPLLPADTMLLHEMCSMKETCNSLSFTKKPGGFDSVKLKFQCLDQTSSVVDFCQPSTSYFNDTFFVTATDYARRYNSCECFINKNKFSIRLEDIRLNSRVEDKCSMASVLVNSKVYRCDPDKNGFGSVFKRTVESPTINAFLSLIPHSATYLPSMVLISVMPEGTARIFCTPKPSSSMKSSFLPVNTTKSQVTDSEERVLSSNNTVYPDTKRSSTETGNEDIFKTLFIVAITVCVITTVVTLLISFCFIKTRKKLKKYEHCNTETNDIATGTPSENEPQSNLNEQQHANGNNSNSVSLDVSSQPSNQEKSASDTSLNLPPPQISERQHSPIRLCNTTSTLGAGSRAPSSAQMIEEQTYVADAIYMHNISSGSRFKKLFRMKKK